MSTYEELFDCYVVVVTDGPIAGYDDGSTIVVFTGQTDIDDEIVEVTFGVDRDTANDIETQRLIDDTVSVPYVLVLVEQWQIISADTEAPL